jgi:hypothetical protein
VLFFIHVASLRVHVAGVTPHPDEPWMVQMARNVTTEEWGFLAPGEYLIHERDGKHGAAFQQLMDDVGVKRVVLPPRSPNLNTHAECWVRSIKEECLSQLILFGEKALWHALAEYGTHYHHKRNTREIIREKPMPCSFVRPAKAVRVTARSSTENCSVDCSSTITVRPPEDGDPSSASERSAHEAL